MWLADNGPIPYGMVMDHICAVRLCMKPLHLQITSNRENILGGESFSAVKARRTLCRPLKHVISGSYQQEGKTYRKCTECDKLRTQSKAALTGAAARSVGMSRKQFIVMYGERLIDLLNRLEWSGLDINAVLLSAGIDPDDAAAVSPTIRARL
jgi:hypothetical protein